MPSFGPPTRNNAAAAKRLPTLRQNAQPPAPRFNGGERRRQRLAALKASATMPVLPKVIEEAKPRAAVEVALQTSMPEESAPQSSPPPEDAPTKKPTDEPVCLDWKVLAACEVVLDRENEMKRKQQQVEAVSKMKAELKAQLDENKARRMRERTRQLEWMQVVRTQARHAAELEQRQAEELRAKRLRDREIFAKQAREQRATLEAAKAARAAEDRAALDAARRSMKSEENRQRRLREDQKKRQEALKKAIEDERKLKVERQQAQWRDEVRIQRESVERAEEMERRRVAALQYRETMIKNRQRIHEQSTGRQEQEEEKRKQELNDRYLAERAKADEEHERAKIEARRNLNNSVLRENAHQLAQRDAERQAAARETQEEKRRMLAAADEFRRAEQRQRADRLNKQRRFQDILDHQIALVRDQRSRDCVEMTRAEQDLNKPLVSKILERPERKRELVGLIH